MSQTSKFAARIVEASASAYAGYAASLMLENHPEIEERYAPSAMSYWKANLTQRVLELAAALSAEEPRLFSSRVLWSQKAFRARELEDEDLRASLRSLSEILREELPEQAHGALTGYLDPAIDSLGHEAVEHASGATQPLGIDAGSASGQLALRYLQAVLEGDSRGAIDLLVAAAENGTSVQTLYLDVLLAAQREVGELWHLGDVGVAEEHYVTTTTERAMAVLAQRAERRPEVGKTVVAAAVAGNTHGLGVRVLADFFEIGGWQSICLGADVPPSEVATAAVYFEADLVVLSAALAVQLQTVAQSVEALRALDSRDVKVLVGGVAFSEAPDLWQRLGADGYAPAADAAVDLGARLLGLETG